MKKKKRSIIPLLVILIAAAAAVVYFGFGVRLGIRKPSEKKASGASAMLASRNSEAVVVRGTIAKKAEGNGLIEAAQKHTVSSDYSVMIDTVEAENGDYLEEGDIIAYVDRDSIDTAIDALQEQINSMNSQVTSTSRDGSESITASVPGRVKRIFAKEGDLLTDVMTEYGGLAEIAADGNLKVVFDSTANLDPGDEVTVIFQNFEEEGYICLKEGDTFTVVIDDSKDYQVDQEAKIEDEKGNVVGSGKLESNAPYLVGGNYGTVRELKVSVNDHVDAGTAILTRDHYSINASYTDLLDRRNKLVDRMKKLRQLRENPVICAESEGILSDFRLTDGMQIMEDTAMYVLISTDTFNLKAQFDELEIAGVEAGQDAEVVFDAFEDEIYDGVVKKVSRVGMNTGGVTTFDVTVEIPGSDVIKTNMSATASVITEEASDVLLVPVDSIQTDDDRKYVTVVNGENMERRYVTLGLVNNTMAEVREGLSEGETVVVIGTSEMEEMMQMMQAGRDTMGAN